MLPGLPQSFRVGASHGKGMKCRFACTPFDFPWAFFSFFLEEDDGPASSEPGTLGLGGFVRFACEPGTDLAEPVALAAGWIRLRIFRP